jgi:hypothetical protein
MAELKTKKTRQSVTKFISDLPDGQRRKDCRAVMKLMREITGAKPAMWGPSIVGFGHYRYKYQSGREGDWFLTGFSPRKQNLTLYIMSGFSRYEDLLRKLGKHKTGKACLYVKKLEDIDLGVLKRLITKSVQHKKRTAA